MHFEAAALKLSTVVLFSILYLIFDFDSANKDL